MTVKNALGIDIGGTKICSAIISETGEILSSIQKTQTPKTKDEIYNLLKNIINEKGGFDVVGLSIAGGVNLENTRISSPTHNLPLELSEIDFSSLSEKKVFVENDANCAAYAEYKIGSGIGSTNMLMVTIGTGIGGGLIYNGNLYRGATGNALEIGRMRILKDVSGKENSNSWEAYASGTGLKNCCLFGIKNYSEYSSSILKKINPQNITTYDIINALKEDDLFSKKVFKQWLDYIGIGLISLTNILSPDCIVISGGMCEFINPQKLQNMINGETIGSNVAVKIATTANNAGMIGVGLLAISDL